MSIDISRETETRLTDEVWQGGVSVEALLQRFIDEHAALIHRPELAQACPSGTSAVSAHRIVVTFTATFVEPGIVDTDVLVYAGRGSTAACSGGSVDWGRARRICRALRTLADPLRILLDCDQPPAGASSAHPGRSVRCR
jgi:hypothetical protein